MLGLVMDRAVQLLLDSFTAAAHAVLSAHPQAGTVDVAVTLNGAVLHTAVTPRGVVSQPGGVTSGPAPATPPGLAVPQTAPLKSPAPQAALQTSQAQPARHPSAPPMMSADKPASPEPAARPQSAAAAKPLRPLELSRCWSGPAGSSPASVATTPRTPTRLRQDAPAAAAASPSLGSPGYYESGAWSISRSSSTGSSGTQGTGHSGRLVSGGGGGSASGGAGDDFVARLLIGSELLSLL